MVQTMNSKGHAKQPKEPYLFSVGVLHPIPDPRGLTDEEQQTIDAEMLSILGPHTKDAMVKMWRTMRNIADRTLSWGNRIMLLTRRPAQHPWSLP